DERFFRRHRVLFWLTNPNRFLQFADVDNSDGHDFLLLRVFPPHPPWLAIPTWNDVLSSSWWESQPLARCAPLLMLEITLYRYTIRDNGTNGRISWRSDQRCTRYGGRDRGESGEVNGRPEKRPK